MKKYFSLLPVLISIIISSVFLNTNYGIKKNVNLSDFALGKETKTYFAKSDNHSLQAAFKLSEFDDVLMGWLERRKSTKILWLGNSQLHAINQLKIGDKTSIEVLHENFIKKGVDAVGFSLPNASVQEHYVMYEYVQDKMPVNYLILPVFFDDLREDDIRPEFFDKELSFETKTYLLSSSVSQKIAKIINVANDSSSNGKQQDKDFGALKETVQDKVERKLNSWLAEKSITWAQRPNARGEIMTSLFILRNTVLGIKPTTKRRMIKARYDTNMKALHDLIKATQRNNTQVIVYIPPIRSDVENPYDAAEYTAFKAELTHICKGNNISCLNLENLVPPQYWGTKEATTAGGQQEIDFMHFQSPGHRLLADEMLSFFSKNF